eukprot:scaffold148_cov341-Pavlova_lutheri.AAC.9
MEGGEEGGQKKEKKTGRGKRLKWDASRKREGNREGDSKGMQMMGAQRMGATNGKKKQSRPLRVQSPHVGSGRK